MWNYAELSQMAKAVGGPEILVKTLTKKGIEIGIKQAKGKYTLVGTIAGIAISSIAFWVYTHFTKDKVAAIGGNDTAEQLLIDGINAYDEEVNNNPGMETLSEITREEAEARIDQYVQEVAAEIKLNKKDSLDTEDDTCPNGE